MSPYFYVYAKLALLRRAFDAMLQQHALRRANETRAAAHFLRPAFSAWACVATGARHERYFRDLQATGEAAGWHEQRFLRRALLAWRAAAIASVSEARAEARRAALMGKVQGWLQDFKRKQAQGAKEGASAGGGSGHLATALGAEFAFGSQRRAPFGDLNSNNHRL